MMFKCMNRNDRNYNINKKTDNINRLHHVHRNRLFVQLNDENEQ